VPYVKEGITRVCIRPLALDIVAGEPAVSIGAVEVTWDSNQEGRWHQVYVNGHLAGVTVQSDDRRLVVSAPVGRDGVESMLLVEVVAVDAADCWTDFGADLTGFGAECGTRVRLTWQAGLYLDSGLESFDVFADGRTGTLDYTMPLNEAPIPAAEEGQARWGFGCGGFGVGGYGRSAACYEWTSDGLEPGTWRFAVMTVDRAGNRQATAADVSVDVTPVPRPPTEFRLSSYDPQAGIAMLDWEPSPDV
jgi:hypothetical protein